MKIKVCGMKYPKNIEALQMAKPDFIGLIFYEKSSRYINIDISNFVKKLDKNIKTVGVFVNSPLTKVIEIVRQYGLDYVQLHGDESIAYTKALYEQHISIIKVFRIGDIIDWENVYQYAPYVSYNLFDTATKNYGGSGLKFNWEQLRSYSGNKPFFLSGGISIEEYCDIISLSIPKLYAIDINSKFELHPGFKNIELINEMINKIRNGNIISR